MRVVIGANSLTGQLTGIGHYTKCLVEGLSRLDEISDLRLLSHGKLGGPIDEAQVELLNRKPSEGQGGTSTLVARLRPVASRIQIVVELYDIVTSIRARHSLRGYSFNDVFHSPDFQFAEFPGKTVVTIPDLSTITYPDFHPASRVSYINKHIERVLRRADHIIAISDFVKRELEERLNVSRDRVTTVYPGVDPNFEPVSRDEFYGAISDEKLEYKKYFIFVSTIEQRKNISRLLKAYESYLQVQTKSAMPLVVVGMPGWNSHQIHEELNRLANTGLVRYLGYVERSYLRLLLAGARALLFPSLYEGFGLPVIEAMQSGTAVLTSRNSAMSEISAGSALLTDALDIREISDSILRLHNDDPLVDKLQCQGLDVGTRFSWDRCAEETFNVYESL